MTIISFANMKGGVGKTTLCVNLAFEIFRRGHKILIVDNDPQFNASSALLKPKAYIDYVLKGEKKSIYDIYEKPPRVGGAKPSKLNPKDFFIRTWYNTRDRGISLDIIPSRIELYETLRNPSHKEYKLEKFLSKHAQEYEYIFIDCPPTPSILTLSAFAASDYVLIPAKPDYFSTLGLPQFLGTLEDFKSDLHDDHDVTPLGVIFTDVPRSLTQDVKNSMDRVKNELGKLDFDLPLFDSRVSHLKVFEKTLWQSVPVHKISGHGIRGKTLAAQELGNIFVEMEECIGES